MANLCNHFISKIESWSQVYPDRAALHHVSEAKPDGIKVWKTFSWSQYFEEVQLVANGLIALGFKEKDCASIVGRNRPEWLFAQMAIMAAGGISTSVYTSNSPNEVAYIINHSNSQFIFAEDKIQYDKIIKERANLPGLQKIILMDSVTNSDPTWTITYEQLKELGRIQSRVELKNRIQKIVEDDVAFYVYTSGTTGDPKAVITNNRGLIYMGTELLKRFPPAKKVRLLSYLPLSHIAEQTVTNIVHLQTGGEVFMCREIESLKDYLIDVRPSILLGVPRVWEKVEVALKARFKKLSLIQFTLLKFAMKIEFDYFSLSSKKGILINPLGRVLVNTMILSKIRKKLGVDKLQYALTGAAPISKSTQDFFASLGIPVMEIYGLTESLGVAISSIPTKPISGSIGYPLNGVKVKIAEDGELLLQSLAVTTGYYKDQKATDELLVDGWLHTGDIATRSADGSYRITDRKKEIIITAGGKNVTPSKIENYLKSIPGISQAVLIGDKRPYLVALLTLETETSEKSIAEQILEINKLLPKDESIKKFKVLPAQFTIESGEMTPTQKLKRRVIHERYSKQINELYSELQ